PHGVFVAPAARQAHGIAPVRGDGVDVEVLPVVHGDEGDAVAARGPRGRSTVGVVVGDAAVSRAVAVHHVQHGFARTVGHVHDFLSVRRPAGRGLDGPGEGEALRTTAARRLAAVQLAVA